MNYEDEISELKKRLEDTKKYYFSQMGKYEQLKENRNTLEKSLHKIVSNIDILEKVKILLQKTSDFAREKAKEKIEGIVTNCLQYIFDSDIKFSIEMNELRGKTEAEFYVVSKYDDEILKTKPQDARGGGVVDIISLALRIAMLECSNIEVQGPIILDEPAKHVSDEYIVQVGEFLKEASKTLNRQVIMVTHNTHLSEIADKAFKVDMDNNRSVTTIIP
jgi:DNA repair exonuclease SbcCD ATPase subunit